MPAEEHLLPSTPSSISARMFMTNHLNASSQGALPVRSVFSGGAAAVGEIKTRRRMFIDFCRLRSSQTCGSSSSSAANKLSRETARKCEAGLVQGC
eukprot:6212761-Pleurochrysis_carterae.AAC.3